MELDEMRRSKAEDRARRARAMDEQRVIDAKHVEDESVLRKEMTVRVASDAEHVKQAEEDIRSTRKFASKAREEDEQRRAQKAAMKIAVEAEELRKQHEDAKISEVDARRKRIHQQQQAECEAARVKELARKLKSSVAEEEKAAISALAQERFLAQQEYSDQIQRRKDADDIRAATEQREKDARDKAEAAAQAKALLGGRKMSVTLKNRMSMFETKADDEPSIARRNK